MLAHIAGIPVEETALSFAPVAAAAGGVASARWRRASGRRRRARRHLRGLLARAAQRGGR